MNVALLELCQELHDLSGWVDTGKAYGKWTPEDKKPFMAEYNYGEFGHDAFRVAPAYDLGYLLRKLPRVLRGSNSRERDGVFSLYAARKSSNWVASYIDTDCTIVRRRKAEADSNNYRNFYWVQDSAQTPEEAVCKLALRLFKEGILPMEKKL